jgi:hypothetical protein
MTYLRKGYLFVLVLAVRLSRWRGDARANSGAMGLGMIQSLALLAIASRIQVELDYRLSAGPEYFLVAFFFFGLFFLNYRVTRSRQYEAMEKEYNLLPRWARWVLLTSFVAFWFLILIGSVRYIDAYLRHFHIGRYQT